MLLCLENVMVHLFVENTCFCLTPMWHSSFFLSYYDAGELLDQISIVKSSSWSEGVSRCVGSPLLSCSRIILTDVIKHRQSKPGSKSLRWVNCCFKQSVFSGCPRQTSGRLVLMFTNRTRWRSLKRATPESLIAACVSAGKHWHNTLRLV